MEDVVKLKQAHEELSQVLSGLMVATVMRCHMRPFPQGTNPLDELQKRAEDNLVEFCKKVLALKQVQVKEGKDFLFDPS